MIWMDHFGVGNKIHTSGLSLQQKFLAILATSSSYNCRRNLRYVNGHGITYGSQKIP